MNRSTSLRILENKFVTLEQAGFCGVPGYLILRVRTGAESFGDLSTPSSQRLGGMLASAAAAIETVLGADRVYCLSFCEVDRTLHFHLFPRTASLLTAYQEASGTADLPVDGPALFMWARENFPAGAAGPADWPTVADVCAALREILDPV